MKKRIRVIITALMLVLAILTSTVVLTVWADSSYTINGVTVRNTDYSSAPDDCWNYANSIYRKIWGQNFSNLFNSSDNMLRNLSDAELTLTQAHLKEYVSHAELGSCLRICDSEYLHIASDGWGHSQIIVQKDDNGFTVFEGGLSASPYRREKYYTWSEYINTNWLGGRYQYIKYIKWPGAQAYNSTPGKPTLNHTISGNKVTFTWKATANTTHYNLWLDKKGSSGQWENVKQIFYANSGLSRTLQPGSYRAQLLSYNSDVWESDGSDWTHTWADDVFFTIQSDGTVQFMNGQGGVWRSKDYEIGSTVTLPSDYPKVSGKYFSGWAYESGATAFQLRPGDAMNVTKSMKLYPVYVTHNQAISGNTVHIYNIQDFTQSGYDVKEISTQVQTKVDASYWSDWSGYSTEKVNASATVEVRTKTLYRYYYFLCPSCGAHEPYWGTSDCGARIPETA